MGRRDNMGPPSKKRKIAVSAVEEVVFDPTARQDYLTGFHKRKVQRTKQAQEAAQRRARQERIDARKILRDDRKADLERHVQEVNALMRPAEINVHVDDDSDSLTTEEWDGIPSPEPPPIDHEAEYIDEDKYTTVTVEAMDVTRDGLFKAEQEQDQQDNEAGGTKDQTQDNRPISKPAGTKQKVKDKSTKPKKKRKKFRYESKAERKVTRGKERSKNSKEAKARRSG